MPLVSRVQKSAHHDGGRHMEYEGCTDKEVISKQQDFIRRINEELADVKHELSKREAQLRELRKLCISKGIEL